MIRCNEIIDEIKSTLSQRSASQKDEVKVMGAMVNDPTFKVQRYDRNGVTDEVYCPFDDTRKMVSSIISESTGISSKEASLLANTYQFTKANSATLVNVSKQFVGTYLTTGRKLPLPATERSAISLQLKEIPEVKKVYQKSIGGGDKNDKSTGVTTVPAHQGIKVASPCPAYLKNN